MAESGLARSTVNARMKRIVRMVKWSATEKQIRAIQTICSKQGIMLANELEARFQVRTPDRLSVGQASTLIFFSTQLRQHSISEDQPSPFRELPRPHWLAKRVRRRRPSKSASHRDMR